MELATRYGPWAVVTGGSEGVGLEWCRALARQGINLLILARRVAVLEEAAKELRAAGVDVRTVARDITDPDLRDVLRAATSEIEVGLVVHNVGSRDRTHGDFLDDSLDVGMKTIDANSVAAVTLTHLFAPAMAERGRGGLIFVGPLAGIAGQALEATYSAAKAFTQYLAEALWSELTDRGVDVVCVPLAGTRTPELEAKALMDVSMLPTAEEVVTEAMAHLQDGPVFVPGEANRRLFDKTTGPRSPCGDPGYVQARPPRCGHRLNQRET
ncbi:SDR family NAD(P)-dependent oxidoreductase [Mycobacterium colombiense]|uniref:SDR family NAD(P)-dependent oxidoreductase n=1 Tax=Mycobacterium colombiense TaxID=339268 RepID=UPI0009E3678C|nr:SDR family NAD(P)-dependent oxidoreductase [Mycobacterium colombiense]